MESASRTPVEVKIYRMTGKQLFFKVGQSVCEECDLAVAAVREAIARTEGIPVRFKVEPWLDKLPLALSRGAYHPPITLVGGRIVSQGVVPDVEEVRLAIVSASRRTKERVAN
jgi:Thioredoxin domain